MKKIICASIILYVLATLFFLTLQENGFFKKTSQQKVYTVNVTHDGFIPDELIIKKDDSVNFVNVDSVPHWPASNPHPIHDLYSEFDPKTAILAHQTWGLEFTRTGDWHYHDHLIPYHTGVITVTK